MNIIASTATMVEPTGVPCKMETKNPISAHVTEMIAEKIVTALKLFSMLIAERAGKIIKADISSLEDNKHVWNFWY